MFTALIKKQENTWQDVANAGSLSALLTVLGGIASYKWIPLTKGQWYMLLCVLNKLFVKE